MPFGFGERILPDRVERFCPLSCLRAAGAMAALRWYHGRVACVTCGSHRVVRNGVQKRRDSRIQQYRCAQCGNCFSEYTGTPLDGVQVTPWQWMLIFHYRSRHPRHRLSYDLIAPAAEMSPRAVQLCDLRQRSRFDPLTKIWVRLKKRCSLNSQFGVKEIIEDAGMWEIRISASIFDRAPKSLDASLDSLTLKVVQRPTLARNEGEEQTLSKRRRRAHGAQRASQRIRRARFGGAIYYRGV